MMSDIGTWQLIFYYNFNERDLEALDLEDPSIEYWMRNLMTRKLAILRIWVLMEDNLLNYVKWNEKQIQMNKEKKRERRTRRSYLINRIFGSIWKSKLGYDWEAARIFQLDDNAKRITDLLWQRYVFATNI